MVENNIMLAFRELIYRSSVNHLIRKNVATTATTITGTVTKSVTNGATEILQGAGGQRRVNHQWSMANF